LLRLPRNKSGVAALTPEQVRGCCAYPGTSPGLLGLPRNKSGVASPTLKRNRARGRAQVELTISPFLYPYCNRHFLSLRVIFDDEGVENCIEKPQPDVSDFAFWEYTLTAAAQLLRTGAFMGQ